MKKKSNRIYILPNADGESHILNMYEGDRKPDFHQTIQLSDFYLKLVVNPILDSEEIDGQLKIFNYNEKVVARSIFKTFKALNNTVVLKKCSPLAHTRICVLGIPKHREFNLGCWRAKKSIFI